MKPTYSHIASQQIIRSFIFSAPFNEFFCMNVRACALITTVYPLDSSSRLQFDNTIYWHTTRYDVRHCLSHQLPISAIACTVGNTKHLNLIILYVHTSRRYSAENAPLQAAKDDLPLSYIHMSLTLSTSLSTVPYAVRLDRANCMCIPPDK